MGAKIETVLETKDPRVLHIKDPFVYGNKLLFCTHPFSWSSSNTGYAVCNPNGEVDAPVFDFFPRGMTWDVAMTRGTAVIDVPRVGAFSELNASLVFYDGGESLRNMDEHATAVKRPRGYSCEELGGVAYIADGDLNNIHRLSRELPMFISPHGTGCSRYVDVMAGHDGLYATWQQSQADLSQPLVLNHVSSERVAALLS